jgi:nucleotide-binding universal stress UspA family protein
MIKDMLVNLSIAAERDTAAEYALALARILDAQLTGVAFVYDPVIAPSVMGVESSTYIDLQRTENEQRAAAAQQAFDRMAAKAGTAVASHVLSASPGGGADRFGHLARQFDLSVVMQSQPNVSAAEDLVVEAALFQSGRPAIVVPYVQKGPLRLDRVMVCWDGNPAAARAIGDAMPLLTRAKTVELVTVTGEEGKPEAIAGFEMTDHLARHGIKAQAKRIVSQDDVQGTLLSHAADSTADFIVMGGYSHSRLREFLLGGVTRAMLESMTLPCLMSH